MTTTTKTEKPRTETSEVARAAADIRKVLKETFPGIKFSVRSESFSMGNAVRVRWDNGPASSTVDALLDRFVYSDFDGMTDSSTYRAPRQDTANRAKYVTTSRYVSSEISASVKDSVAKLFGGSLKVWQIDDYANRALCRADLTKGLGEVAVRDGGIVVLPVEAK